MTPSAQTTEERIKSSIASTFAPTLELKPNTDEIIRTLQLLHAPGIVELRSFETPEGIWSGYYNASTLFAKDACELASRETTPSIYHTLQDISLDLFNRRPNCARGHIGTGETTSDADTVKYRWLPLDADPKRIGKVSSTDLEKALALEVAKKIQKFLSDRGIPTILADSGNGYHLLVRIDLPIEDQELVENLLHAFSGAFSTDAVLIDTAVSNPSRIWKLYGVPARKGKNSPERPWRMSKLLDAPEGIQKSPVLRDALVSLLKDLRLLNPAATTTNTTTTVEKKPVNVSVNGEKIPNGRHDIELSRISGKLRHDGMEEDSIYNALVEICEKRFEGLGSDYLLMCRKHAANICKKPIGKDTTVLVNGAVAGSVSVGSVGSVPLSQPITPEIDQTALAPRPVFPLWAIEQTSLYEGFVRPVVESSSKNPEFLWLPAVQLTMNYFSDKVRIEFQTMNWNLFLGLVSDPGKYFKSSSCKLAQQYHKLMGLAQTYTPAIRNSEGKVIIMQAGSSEGFGLAMSKINSKHGIMFNDELGKLVAKVGIENSSMASDILSFYERDDFGNATTNEKNRFNFEADTYTFGLCWCTTARGFNRHWPRLAGVVSGMEDRMFFCVGPEKPRPLVSAQDVPLQDAANKTRQLIDQAIENGVYRYENIGEAQQVMSRWDDPRSQGLIERFSLYFAVDLNRDCIDSECLERAGAIVDFRNAGSAFLSPIEADNQIGRIQQEMARELRKNGGKMTYRLFFNSMQGSRLGMPLWKQCYNTMIEAGFLIEFYERGKRGQKRHMVGLPKIEDED